MEEKNTLSKFRIKDKIKIEDVVKELDDFADLPKDAEKEKKYLEITSEDDYGRLFDEYSRGNKSRELIEKLIDYKNKIEEILNSNNQMEKPITTKTEAAGATPENSPQKAKGGEVKKKWKIENVYKEDRKDAKSGEWLKTDIKEAEWRSKEMEKKIRKKKEEANKSAQEGVEKVEKSHGSVMDVKEAKIAGKELETKVETSAQKAEEAAEVKKSEMEKAEKRIESKKIQEELDSARKEFSSITMADHRYPEIEEKYKGRVEQMKEFLTETKRSALEKRGLTPEEIEKELDKYSKEYIAPHFAVVEAAKIQNAKSEANPSFVEKMKDNKITNVAYKAIDWYKKRSFKEKMLISGGLIAGGALAVPLGGVLGAAFGTVSVTGVWAQKILGAAGTAVGAEALIQRSQQKWMEKNGWGKNRHELVAKEIAKTREATKKQEIRKSELEEVGGMEEVRNLLDERRALETKLEKRRTVMAGFVGALVGSGAAFQAVKQFGELAGITGHTIPKGAILEKAMSYQEKPISLKIGARGPEGSIIDYFKGHSDVAKQFGWDGKADLSKWAGAEAHKLWLEDARQTLAKPEVLAEMKKLGYPQNAEGYTEMAHKIGKGFVSLDVAHKGIDIVDTDYLRNSVEHLQKIAEGKLITGPSGLPEFSESEKIIYNLVDQGKVAEYEKQMQPFMNEMVDKLKAKGLSMEEIIDRQDKIVEEVIAEMKNKGITIDASAINLENLQKIMESPEGKMGAIISNLANIEQKNLNSIVARMGGWDKFTNSNVSALFESKGGPIDVSLSKFGMELQRLTGDAPSLYGTASIKEILKSINSKDIFGGTAEELIKKGI